MLSDHAELLYKTTDFWVPEHERTIIWDDRDLGIGGRSQRAPDALGEGPARSAVP